MYVCDVGSYPSDWICNGGSQARLGNSRTQVQDTCRPGCFKGV